MLVESLCVIIEEHHGYIGFEGLIRCFPDVYFRFEGLFIWLNQSVGGLVLTPFRHSCEPSTWASAP